MKTLTELIQNYQNGIPDSDSEILKRMEPLVKGYASRICKLRSNGMPVPLLRNGYSIFNGTKYR